MSQHTPGAATASGTFVPSTFERALANSLAHTGMPPHLRAASEHAVFGGGARLRPHLLMAVHAACQSAGPGDTMAAAICLELLHCASLVHDDLPCFDNAMLRRGQPTVHRRFGEAVATLTGDGLIVAAFASLAHATGLSGPVAQEIAGAARRLVCGQAQECEPEVNIEAYHAAKTGALFEAATVCGALLAGHDGEAWRPLGHALGAAYQLADDLADSREDAAHCRHQPNAAGASMPPLASLMRRARSSVPLCNNMAPLTGWFAHWEARLSVAQGSQQHGAASVR